MGLVDVVGLRSPGSFSLSGQARKLQQNLVKSVVSERKGGGRFSFYTLLAGEVG